MQFRTCNYGRSHLQVGKNKREETLFRGEGQVGRAVTNSACLVAQTIKSSLEKTCSKKYSGYLLSES